MIRVLHKAFAMLALFEEGNQPLPVAALSRALKFSRGTTSRIAATLAEHGFLRRDPSSGAYTLGYRFLELAGVVSQSLDLPTIGWPHLTRLRDATKETVALHIPLDAGHTCIATVPGLWEIRYSLNLGKLLPYYAGASGKLLLAHQAPERVADYLNRTRLVKLGPNTITSRRRLEREMAAIRKRGFSLSVQERGIGGMGISAPIRDFQGEVVAALTIYALVARTSVEELRRYSSQLLTVAAAISKALGSRTAGPVGGDGHPRDTTTLAYRRGRRPTLRG